MNYNKAKGDRDDKRGGQRGEDQFKQAFKESQARSGSGYYGSGKTGGESCPNPAGTSSDRRANQENGGARPGGAGAERKGKATAATAARPQGDCPKIPSRGSGRMSQAEKTIVLYWDASAILSALIKDAWSEEARKWARQEGVHLLSTLAYAEVLAVLFRMKRERMMAEVLVKAALETLGSGSWRRLNPGPTWVLMAELSKRWSLRGADLWHLSTAKSVSEHLPEVKFLTFDPRLRDAARGEGIGL